MKKQTLSDFLYLNLSIFCISTSGVLGKSIPLNPEVIIFWRSFLAIPFFIIYLYFRKQSILSLGQLNCSILLAGILMGVHWVTYFYSLQWSNVAIGMLSLFTFPIITAFLEPFFFPVTFQIKHLFIGLLTLLGIYFLVPSVTYLDSYGWAVAMGIFSALCYALRNLILKKSLQAQGGTQLMLSQVIIISLCFSPWFSTDQLITNKSTWQSILFLSLITTVVGHSLFLNSLGRFNITTASIFSTIQPLHGIAIAFFMIGEIPYWGAYLGGSLILCAVFIEQIWTRQN